MSTAEKDVKQHIDEAQQLIVVESTPAVLSVNFDEMNAYLDQWLEKYQTVVTADGVKDAKTQATEINKLKTAIQARKKEEIDRVSAPISEFKANMESLEKKCESTRVAILDQVKVYEDETRDKVCTLLCHLRDELFADYGVTEEFQAADVEDLILISNITGKGALTAKAKEALTARVRNDKAQQDMVEKRLLVLENRSFRAGLKEPLTRQTIEHFLRADDETYEAKLQALLEAEVKRQDETERRIRADMEKQQATEQAKQQEPAPEAAPQHQPVTQVDEAQGLVDVPPDKELVTATATFRITVPSHVSNEMVAQKLRDKLEAAGITTLDEINVSRI